MQQAAFGSSSDTSASEGRIGAGLIVSTLSAVSTPSVGLCCCVGGCRARGLPTAFPFLCSPAATPVLFDCLMADELDPFWACPLFPWLAVVHDCLGPIVVVLGGNAFAAAVVGGILHGPLKSRLGSAADIIAAWALPLVFVLYMRMCGDDEIAVSLALLFLLLLSKLAVLCTVARLWGCRLLCRGCVESSGACACDSTW